MNITRHLSSWYKDIKLVVIKLTEDETTYVLPKRMVCDMSEYFAKVLEEDSEETQLRTLKLSDCSAETFDVVLGFHVYYGLPHDIKSEHQAQLLLVNLWFFGDTYLLPHLKIEAFKVTSEILDHQPPCPGVLAEVLASGSKGLRLKSLFIVRAISCIIQGGYNEAERAELAEIEGFFKIMADVLAAAKSSQVIANALARAQNSYSRSLTNVTASVQTGIGSTLPTTATTVHPSYMPTSTPFQAGPPAFDPPATATARRRARRQANKASRQHLSMTQSTS
ncbi:hypothetical protein KC318_g2594 [Hortaea werneckii]|uniref:BTB domain-containing protein n=1 Tax=Hortaea werneckii TaxID=91943 RepID=A0A3M7BDA5_HORWE|nr:hypothetical protein KC334_g1976 [Hortaea werneckii]KAI7022788.1 hypothetical protein KC355_g1951 [Hortaea werneckii]KAI7672846.1 hypothetical protein KC318_g2594 [Hortaea werneckii]RMY14856.1 hypothetical protein D0867_07014 [Hortaea werneckii]RMY37638.1 hypothetical protein D0866_03138 [Hortaea werneckii]